MRPGKIYGKCKWCGGKIIGCRVRPEGAINWIFAYMCTGCGKRKHYLKDIKRRENDN